MRWRVRRLKARHSRCRPHAWSNLPAWLLAEGSLRPQSEWDGDEEGWKDEAFRHDDFVRKWRGGFLEKISRLGLDQWSREYNDFHEEKPGRVIELATTNWERDGNPDWDRDMEAFARFLPEILAANNDGGKIAGLMLDIEDMRCSAFAADRNGCVIEEVRPDRLLEKLKKPVSRLKARIG